MSEEAKRFSTPILILMIICGDGFFGFFLFLLSGNFLWMEAWVFLIILTFLMSYMFVWLNRHNPQVLRSRTSMKGMMREDIITMILFAVAFFAFVIVVCLDGGRYHWSMVPLWGKIIGFVGFVAGFVITGLVMKENPFASKVVRVDKEGGHRVISTGPYAVVRHPMYSGFVLLFVSISIALGSLYGFIPLGFLTILLIVRIHFEEELMHEELEGYTEYTKKVRKKLIPWVW